VRAHSTKTSNDYRRLTLLRLTELAFAIFVNIMDKHQNPERGPITETDAEYHEAFVQKFEEAVTLPLRSAYPVGSIAFRVVLTLHQLFV